MTSHRLARHAWIPVILLGAVISACSGSSEDTTATPTVSPTGTDAGGKDDITAGGDAGDGGVGPSFGPPVVLAPAQTGLRGLAMDATDVFLTDGQTNTGGIVRRATRRPTSAVGAAVAIVTATFGVTGTGLAVTTKGLFYSCYNGSWSICFVAKGGGTPKPFITEGTGLAGWDHIAPYGAGLWVTAPSGTWTFADDLTGLTRTSLATGTFPNVDAASVYVASANQIQRLGKVADAGIDVVADQQLAIRGLALDATTLYWALEGGQILAIDKTATVGTPRVLATGQAGPSSLAIDTDGVYFTNAGDGTVARVPKAGGPVQIVARDQAAPRALRADDAGLVWVNSTGDVVGVLKR